MSCDQHSNYAKWLSDFRERNRRNLRVLHIGNIANNAYNNAKIQRKAGIEADVICYDYYHIMGCPEWEDHEFSGAIDAFYPDWWATDLKGPRRPFWFAQGPLLKCIAYLNALRGNGRFRSWYWWQSLELSYWRLLDQRAKSERKRRSANVSMPGRYYVPVLLLIAFYLSGMWVPNALKLAAYRIVLWRDWYVGYRSRAVAESEQRLRRSNLDWRAKVSWRLKFWRSRLHFLLYLVKTLLRAGKALPGQAIRMKGVGVGDAIRTAKQMAELYDSYHPNALSHSRAADLEYLCDLSLPWLQLLKHYDVIQGYSTDGLIPMRWGRQYCAYEHGTLREIPFEDSIQGRVCNLTYRKADVVFITNSDVLPMADALGIRADQRVYLPHAVDDRKIATFAANHGDLQPPKDGRVHFFCPARQHWKVGGAAWCKGNDRYIRAAAILAARGVPIQLTMVAWGAELDLSRQLIDELGCADIITWVDPMRKRELLQSYLRAHAVIDQFVIPALGGVAFEAMGVGRRLITYIDADCLEKFFGKAPPLMAAETVEQIIARMQQVADDLEDSAGLGAAALNWIRDYHSSERILSLQVGAYSRMLSSGGAVRDAAE